MKAAEASRHQPWSVLDRAVAVSALAFAGVFGYRESVLAHDWQSAVRVVSLGFMVTWIPVGKLGWARGGKDVRWQLPLIVSWAVLPPSFTEGSAARLSG
jgi:hypothetical protein